ncbi:hypothetical protein [Alicycliphilus denitrificans]|uniref:hypothetical protein n=1 Tax=Alicycliphilus denitrificans TaxID=179636 RepID=UPI0001DA0DF7|nr:hypothetical protein [Alicycliphilus denitrificans]ADV01299.1 hypothetical protein Alide_3582 [Alicycliphilus denitrificans BC]
MNATTADPVNDLIRDMMENVAKYGGENTTTFLMVQAIKELQRQHKALDCAGLAASPTAQTAPAITSETGNPASARGAAITSENGSATQAAPAAVALQADLHDLLMHVVCDTRHPERQIQASRMLEQIGRASPQPPAQEPAEPLPPPGIYAGVHYATFLRREAHKHHEPKAGALRNAARMIDVLLAEVQRLHRELIVSQAQEEAQKPDGWLPVHFSGGRFYGGPLKTEDEAKAYIEQVHRSNDSITLRARPFVFADRHPAPQQAVPVAVGDASDTARLDHLQQRGATIDLVPGEGDFYPTRFRVGGLHATVSTDIRPAIDAARAQAKEGGTL